MSIFPYVPVGYKLVFRKVTFTLLLNIPKGCIIPLLTFEKKTFIFYLFTFFGLFYFWITFTGVLGLLLSLHSEISPGGVCMSFAW